MAGRFDIRMDSAIYQALKEEFGHVQEDPETLVKPRNLQEFARWLLAETLTERRRRRP